MSSIVIGKAGSKNVTLDLDKLLSTRLLVQANSGKGKSHLLRRIAEQLFGKVQVIILDPEGEFATLREKYGYVLVGKGGETSADPRSAALVAHKLLELRASAVCDLYEMKPATRHEWVQKFLDAMIDAPKNLWHPCVVIVDEAHVFAPEKGAGESLASEAMIGLATRGRKRGFALIAATQRLGKLRKDAAAELLNIMVGGTFIDVDRKRAADALGVYGNELHKFFDDIKVMERGDFYALGPALSVDRVLVHVGEVETTHPEAGSAKHGAEPPPAPEAIARLLPKLSDLPKAAEEKARTEAELLAQIRTLKAQLRSQPTQPVEAKVVDQAAIERARKDVYKLLNDGQMILQRAIKRQYAALKDIAERASAAASLEIPTIEPLPPLPKVSGGQITKKEERQQGDGPLARTNVRPDVIPETGDLTGSQLRILQALVHLESVGEGTPSREQVAFWSAAPPTSGGFKNNLGSLRSRGMISYPTPGTVLLSEAGRAAIGVNAFSDDDAYQAGLGLLSDSQRKLLDELISSHPIGLERETLAERVGVPATSGGFKNNLGAMRTAGLVEYPEAGSVKCADWLLRS